MATPFELAMAVYDNALATVARRAGVTTPQTTASPAWQRRAWELALGGALLDAESAPPALKSLPARLFDQKLDAYYAPQVMRSAASIPRAQPPADLAQQYEALWSQFTSERDDHVTAGQSAKVREANLHALLQRYTWAMAAPQTANPLEDVSLFDAARVAAAFAVCMGGDENTDEALLIGGDLSGVQEWLYTLGSEGAAKTLRGRSFYLQLLSELLAQTLIDRLGLPQANLLYAGGGNFYVLAPAGAEAQLDAIRREIGERLLAMHQGALSVAIACVRKPLAELSARASSAWDALHRQLNRRKLRRFEELEDALIARHIGAPLDNTGEPKHSCKVCGRTMVKGEKAVRIDEVTYKCSQCVSFEQLGDDLRQAKFVVLTRVEPAPAEVVTDWRMGLRSLGFDVQLLRNAVDTAAVEWKDPGGEFATIYFWESNADLTEFPGWPGAKQTVWAYRPLAQCAPQVASGNVADFKEIAQASEGIDRWGVLRMDVDNLGHVFQQGLAGGRLCRIVGLSGLLRLFFEGRVSDLGDAWNERDRPRVYTMYAGGDDLFIVGSWSCLPELAWQIRNEFARFAGGNPQLTLSAGISLALDEKYPLYQAARDADRAERAAKALEGKDGICFLGQALKWEGASSTDFATARARADQVRRWLQEESRVPRSVLMTLRSIDAEWKVWSERETGSSPAFRHMNQELMLGPWLWHMEYSLSRAGERSRDSVLRGEINDYVRAITGGEIVVLGFTARWVELWTRKN